MKAKLWKAIEAYRTAGGSNEHWARKDALDDLIDDILEGHDIPWVTLIDDMLKNASLGTATAKDNYELAKLRLTLLINWHSHMQEWNK